MSHEDRADTPSTHAAGDSGWGEPLPERPMGRRATPLDKDLKKIARLERATLETGRASTRIGIAILFLLAVCAYVALRGEAFGNTAIVVAAGVVGAYMALNRSEEHTSELQSLMRISY